jgi:hypothetical protein
MSSLAIAGVIFACIFIAALLGMLAARLLPAHHLSDESKDVVKLGLGVIATLTALVLGLLIGAAKGTFDAQSSTVKELSTKIILVDRLLVRYGPETQEARVLFKEAVTIMLNTLWPEDGNQKAVLTTGAAMSKFEAFYDQVNALDPKTDPKRDDMRQAIKSQILSLTTDLAQTRLRLAAQRESSIPLPFLAVMVSWLVVLFAGYGLMAPRNTTVVLVLLICALSISTALFLILELDKPFDGYLRVSSTPIRDALVVLDK